MPDAAILNRLLLPTITTCTRFVRRPAKNGPRPSGPRSARPLVSPTFPYPYPFTQLALPHPCPMHPTPTHSPLRLHIASCNERAARRRVGGRAVVHTCMQVGLGSGGSSGLPARFERPVEWYLLGSSLSRVRGKCVYGGSGGGGGWDGMGREGTRS
ncbi:hypothetical protein EJ04DRAFT_510869 [Polyplosphaeria fusca]|uniref:Uncharacterized protein n=1 Tax=Polyplosphaeria fusca TaxID=682080 RepID=A0A9P4R4B4_9PLEO|nr:hypothetical protein EJ04DRAFT_510869 [Polyplosphaeria fusca]